MWTVLLFILVLSVLVLVHEFGHFLAARKTGMKVYEFGLGYPPMAIGVYRDPQTKKFVWVRRKDRKNQLLQATGGKETQEEFPATLYSINILPLGGFTKIKGENGEEMNERDSFGAQKAWKKSVVLVAGVAMNFVLAALLLGVGFVIGLPTDIGDTARQDQYIIIDEEPRVVVEQVEDGSVAQASGIQFGDTIISLNGTMVTSSKQVTTFVRDHGTQALALAIDRNGTPYQFSLSPKIMDEGKPARIGVLLGDIAVVRYPWYIALYKGFVAAFFGIINIVVTLFLLLKGLFFHQGLAFDVSGPVGIAVVVGQSARMGLNYLINVTAMISLSLVVLNILPIPALDGGRLLFVVIEKIFRRKVPMKYEQMAHTIGFLLLMLLVIVVTGRDILALF